MKTLAFAIMTATYFYAIHRMDCEDKMKDNAAPLAYGLALVMFIGTCVISVVE